MNVINRGRITLADAAYPTEQAQLRVSRYRGDFVHVVRIDAQFVA